MSVMYNNMGETRGFVCGMAAVAHSL